MELTDKQIQAYIDNEGEHCPYCESEHGVWNNYADHKICQNPSCEKEWDDETIIAGIKQ